LIYKGLFTTGLALTSTLIYTPVSYAGEPSSNDLLKITVTGERKENQVIDYAGSVDVIDKNDLELNPTNSIRNLLRDIPGVTTRNSVRKGSRGTPGTTDVNIRGMEGDRNLFIIDNVRLPDRYEYGGYYDLGRANYVDFSFLNSVEIIKGPSSSLWGSDALGGVISYESLTPFDILVDNESFAFEPSFTLSSENGGRIGTLKVANRISDKLSTLLIYTNESSGETRTKADDGYLNDEDNSGNNYFANIQYDLNDSSSFNLIYESIDRVSEVTDSPKNLALLAGSYFSEYQSLVSDTETQRQRMSLEYNYQNNDEDYKFIDSASIIGSWQYSRIDDNFDRRVTSAFSRQTYDEQKKYYLKQDQLSLSSEFNTPFELAGIFHDSTWGIDYSQNKGSRLRTTNNLTYGTQTIEKDTPDTTIQRLGIFFQDSFSFGDFDLVAGIRFDDYNLEADSDALYEASQGSSELAKDQHHTAFSPKLSVSYNIDDNSNIYAAYSHGFRPGSWFEINSSFENPRGRYTTQSNPDLKPETSRGVELGYKGSYDQIDISLAAYYNKYDDFIEQLKNTGETDYRGFTIYKTENISEAEIFGVELSARYFLNQQRDGFNISNVMSFSEGNDTTNDIPLTTVIPFTNRTALEYRHPSQKWSSSLGMTFVGEQRVDSSYDDYVPSAYATFDFTSEWRPTDNVLLSLGIYNIFDKRYYNFQDLKGVSSSDLDLTRYSQPERNIQASIKFKF